MQFNMKFIIVFMALLIATAYSAPQSSSKDARIIKYENDIGLTGYNFAYETSDGISRQEAAELKNAGSKDESLTVKGSYSWFDADGKQYVVNYIADEDGFKPEGEHIPQQV